LSPQKSISSISSCKDIVQCAFSLNDFEVEVFRSAFKHGPMRADELADLMGVERSKVYRALQKLLSCGMCIRETKSLEKGGYYHVYSTIDRDVLRSKMERCIGEWNERMRDAMARFDERSPGDII
jgi:predicted transcriptional regulator